MAKADRVAIRLHEDVSLFQEAVNLTAARTGHSAQLIEKDYLCSVMLAYLAGTDGLVFKGGTCLSKVLLGFHRLSEDMDFAFSLPCKTGGKTRSETIAPLKKLLSAINKELLIFKGHDSLRGSNNSCQYNGAVRYRSLLSGVTEQIAIEVSLREPLLTPVVTGSAKSILLNPVTEKPFVAEVPFSCISLQEALAEKVRAALTRREVAVRDFYDLHHVMKHTAFNYQQKSFLKLVRQKLATPGTDPVNTTSQKLSELRRQVETRLKPVLRPMDLERFDLDEAYALTTEIAAKLGGSQTSSIEAD
jgi:predicted nucleotidyltransferase component of viral defense system